MSPRPRHANRVASDFLSHDAADRLQFKRQVEHLLQPLEEKPFELLEEQLLELLKEQTREEQPFESSCFGRLRSRPSGCCMAKQSALRYS